MSDLYGIYRGTVYDPNDPDARGRVRALVPQVYGGQVSGWIETTQTPANGFKATLGERIWVSFEGGDVNKPVYVSSERITADKIEADSVAAALGDFITVTADQVTAGTFRSQVAIGEEIVVWPLDDEGNQVGTFPAGRWSAVDGLHMYDVNGFEKLTADSSSGTFVFRGAGEFDSLSVLNGSIQGGGNEIAEGAALTLQSGVTTPKNAPTVSIGYDTTQLIALGRSQDWGLRRGLVWDGTYWWTVSMINGAIYLEHYNSSGGLVESKLIKSSNGDSINGGLAWETTTNNLFILSGLNPAAGPVVWSVHKVDKAARTIVETATWTHADGNKVPAIGWSDSTGTLVIAQSRATNDVVRWRRYNFLSGILTQSGSSVDLDSTYDHDLSSAMFDTFDFGADRYTVTKDNASENLRITNSSGVTQDANRFALSATVIGMHWDGFNFYSLDSSGTVRKYEAGNLWSTSTDENWFAAYTWYRSTGTLESLRSPYTSFTMKKRAKLTVQTASLPVGGATPPTEARIYLKRGTLTPGPSPNGVNMTRQASTTGAPPTLVIVNATFASNNNPAASTFAAGTPSSILSSDGSTMMLATDSDQAFTPVLTAGTTNPTGYTATGHYRIEGGKWITIHYDITFPSNANAGAGQYILSVPPGVSLTSVYSLFALGFRDVSLNDSYTILAMVDTTNNTFRLQALPDTGIATNINRVMNANVPVAVNTGDKLVGTIVAKLT